MIHLKSVVLLFLCAVMLSACMTTHDYPEAPVTQGQAPAASKGAVWGYDPDVCVGTDCTCGAGEME